MSRIVVMSGLAAGCALMPLFAAAQLPECPVPPCQDEFGNPVLDCPASPGCSIASVDVTLDPDRPATIYVTLRSFCGAAADKLVHECSVNFTSPLGKAAKCRAMVAAIEDSTECADNFFRVIDECDFRNPPRYLVRDECCGSAEIQVGISCDPFIFSETGDEEVICDYEADLIQSGCGPGMLAASARARPSFLPTDDTDAELTLKGVATGEPIVAGEPSSAHIQIVPPGVVAPVGLRDFEVLTVPGMTSQEIIEQFRADIEAEGIPGLLVETDGNRTLILRRDSLLISPPPGASIASNDTGLRRASVIGPMAASRPQFPTSPTSPSSAIAPFRRGVRVR